MFFRRRTVFVLAITLWCAGAARAASSIYMPIERVAAISPLIVEGTVARTASGIDPASGALATYVTVDISYVLRGPAELERVVLREPGGRAGDVVHAVDAVPVFQPGERVLLFLEPASDRSLRVAGMFFGKLELREAASGRGRVARRQLSGQGLIYGRPTGEVEEFAAAEIESVIATVPFEGPPRGRARAGAGTRAIDSVRATAASEGWLAIPEGFDQLRWEDVREVSAASPVPGDEATGAARSQPDAPRVALEGAAPAEVPIPSFAAMSSSYPARWHEADTSTAVAINIQPGGNPLNDSGAAIDAMNRAMAAWTNVPEARVVLQPGNTGYDFVGANAQGPADAYPPVNIVLFNDPYNDITDPSGCSGTLAIGGYWRSGSNAKLVNGVSFFPLLRQYVIFNNNFQCFLGNADNLAEVAAHELGHGMGFGHSAVPDAIMRSSAYGNGRGPRLGDDERDGAHCHYPHLLAVTSPLGGESWETESTHAITWSASAEAGSDPGTVDIEYSADAGSTWSVLRTSEPNDGSYPWTIASGPNSQSLIRVVRHNRLVPTPAPYPEACSKDASDAPFTIVAAESSAVAGTSPDGTSEAPLRVEKAGGGSLALTWGPSCSPTASSYAIYEGTLAALKSGAWDHAPKTCAAGTDLAETIVPGSASSYYLVAPVAPGKEGLLGPSSTGERPPSASACAPRETASCP